MPDLTDDEKTAIVTEAKARFKVAVDMMAKQVQRELECLEFQFDPWPQDVKKNRQGGSVAGVPIPPRPMLSIPTLDQPLMLIENQEKAAHLGVSIHPVSDDATDETAEILQDLYRDIEVKSRASIGRDWAFHRGIRCGRGAYRVDKIYADEDNEGPGLLDQKLVINRILNQGAVYFDPMAQQPDWSDGKWAFVSEWMPQHEFERKYPKSTMVGYESEDFESLGDSRKYWVTTDDDGNRSIRVTEYWVVELSERVKCLYQDEQGQTLAAWKDEAPKDAQITVERTVEVRVVKWHKLTGLEVLESQEWDGQYIPIIPFVGRESNVDGNRRWDGVVGPAMDAARLFNYGVSSAVETAALATKAPWMLAEGQEEGHEQEFLQASTRNFPYLRYKPTTVAGQPVGPPTRVQAGSDISSAIALIEQAKDYVHTATFAFEPTLGQSSSNRSGKAVLALQQQSDQGNSNYLDNLAQVSMTYEAMVILDLIPKVYDRPGRIVQLRGKDDAVNRVMLNQPFQMQGNRPQAVPPGMPPQGAPGPQQPQSPVKHYDLTKGRYGVTVSVGKSYQTRIQQGSDQLGQLLQAEPSLIPILGRRWAKFQEWPGHEEASEDLKLLRPPQLQQKDQGPGPNPQQIAQMQAQMQQMQQQLQAAGEAIKTDQAKQQATIQKAHIDAASAERIAQIREDNAFKMQAGKNATEIEKARISAKSQHATTLMEAQEERLALYEDSNQAALDRQHEVGMGAADHAAAQMQADQQHQQALAQGQQNVAGQMATAQQQAALQPPPQPNGQPE